MNKQRRCSIKEAISNIEIELKALKKILLEEEMSFDSLSEGLQATMRGQESEECIEILDENIDKIEEACDEIKSIT